MIDYINYYRIYFWNISRQIKNDNANKFINIYNWNGNSSL